LSRRSNRSFAARAMLHPFRSPHPRTRSPAGPKGLSARPARGEGRPAGRREAAPARFERDPVPPCGARRMPDDLQRQRIGRGRARLALRSRVAMRCASCARCARCRARHGDAFCGTRRSRSSRRSAGCGERREHRCVAPPSHCGCSSDESQAPNRACSVPWRQDKKTIQKTRQGVNSPPQVAVPGDTDAPPMSAIFYSARPIALTLYAFSNRVGSVAPGC
jgi:hypothetical protein